MLPTTFIDATPGLNRVSSSSVLARDDFVVFGGDQPGRRGHRGSVFPGLELVAQEPPDRKVRKARCPISWMLSYGVRAPRAHRAEARDADGDARAEAAADHDDVSMLTPGLVEDSQRIGDDRPSDGVPALPP